MSGEDAGCAVIVVVLLFMFVLIILAIITGNSAVPISGVVVEKVEAANGYGDVVHVMKIEIAHGEYQWITTSARVYLSVVEGARYEFGGPKDGRSYNSVKAIGE